jgi:hypothetical protein
VSSAGKYTVVLRSKDAERGAAVDPDEHLARHRELEARAAARRHVAPGADKNDKAEKWLNSAASRGAGQRPVPVAALQHDVADHARAEPAVLGAVKAKFKTSSSGT